MGSFDRRRLLQGSAAASALALAAPALLRSAAAQGGPIRIGFPVPLTGAFGAEANDQVRAAQLAINDAIVRHGVHGSHAQAAIGTKAGTDRAGAEDARAGGVNKTVSPS